MRLSYPTSELVGKAFNRWTAICFVERTPNRQRLWKFRCVCGSETITNYKMVVQGKSKSCGCLKLEKATTHGQSHTSLYRLWRSMRARCRNPKSYDYKNYGARGITVCGRWDDFLVFAADMGPRPSPHHTVDRVDNNGNYCPENCRWATRREQAGNRRSNRLLTHNGITLTVTDWGMKIGISRAALFGRLRRGFPIEEVLTL